MARDVVGEVDMPTIGELTIRLLAFKQPTIYKYLNPMNNILMNNIN